MSPRPAYGAAMEHGALAIASRRFAPSLAETVGHGVDARHPGLPALLVVREERLDEQPEGLVLDTECLIFVKTKAPRCLGAL